MAEKLRSDFVRYSSLCSGGLGWVVARLPFDVDADVEEDGEAAGEGGGRVAKSFAHRCFRMRSRGGHFVLVNKKMQKAAGAKVGAMVDFAIAPDLDERDADGPSGVGEAAEDGEETGEVV